ncbi:MAG: YfiR family protein [Nitrospiraceae bacterium]|nr:YfiR family protein [Nitrospiraceae bacterium]
MVTGIRHFRAAALRLALAMLAGLTMLSPWAGHSQAAAGTEQELKIAFLYNFAKFVEWPEKQLVSVEHVFSICIIGNDKMHEMAGQLLRDKQIQGRKVVTYVPRSPEQIRKCQILFVDSSATERIEGEWGVIGNAPILTVGETESFVRQGGIIHFFVEEGTIRFAISPKAAERAELKISSKLLKLGRIVEAE